MSAGKLDLVPLRLNDVELVFIANNIVATEIITIVELIESNS